MDIKTVINEKFPYVNQTVSEWYQGLFGEEAEWSAEYLGRFWASRNTDIGIACSPVDYTWYWQVCEGKEVFYSDEYYDTKQDAEDAANLHMADMLEEFPDDAVFMVNFE